MTTDSLTTDHLLLAGAAEIDITPPVGTPLMGSLKPRPSVGVDDPLLVKVLVVESGDTRLAYAIFDLAVVGRETGDAGVRAASERTGIPEDHIVLSATHTHSGPVALPGLYPKSCGDPVDHAWLAGLPERLAECVARADAAKVPVRLSRTRGYCGTVSQNRRLCFKDGREINTWLLDRGEDEVQAVGSAGPVDPELGMLAFDDLEGRPVAIVFAFALHANAHFGSRFSGDYPAVVAARMRERFGPQVTTLFVPGACGDLNHICTGHRDVGDTLAAVMLRKLEGRQPIVGPVRIGACKREVRVRCREASADQEERLQASQWGADEQEFFRESLEEVQAEARTHVEALVQAWHIGDTAFASFPGEPFVELGLALKRRSVFPWTYPVELGGDFHGYLVTEQAWAGGGYESLVASTGRVDPSGSQAMVEANLDLLAELYARSGGAAHR